MGWVVENGWPTEEAAKCIGERLWRQLGLGWRPLASEFDGESIPIGGCPSEGAFAGR